MRLTGPGGVGVRGEYREACTGSASRAIGWTRGWCSRQWRPARGRRRDHGGGARTTDRMAQSRGAGPPALGIDDRAPARASRWAPTAAVRGWGRCAGWRARRASSPLGHRRLLRRGRRPLDARRDARAQRPLPGRGADADGGANACLVQPHASRSRRMARPGAPCLMSRLQRRSGSGAAIPTRAAGHAARSCSGRWPMDTPAARLRRTAARRRRRRLHRSDDRRRHPPGAGGRGARRDRDRRRARRPARCRRAHRARRAPRQRLGRSARSTAPARPGRLAAERAARRRLARASGRARSVPILLRRRRPAAARGDAAPRSDRARHASPPCSLSWAARRALPRQRCGAARAARSSRPTTSIGRCSGRIRSGSWRWASKAPDRPGAAHGAAPGPVVFGAAKALKVWAIASLGARWTFRVLVPARARRWSPRALSVDAASELPGGRRRDPRRRADRLGAGRPALLRSPASAR